MDAIQLHYDDVHEALPMINKLDAPYHSKQKG